MFDCSSQLPSTTAESEVIKLNQIVRHNSDNIFRSWKEPLSIWLINGSENFKDAFIGWTLNFRVLVLLKGAVKSLWNFVLNRWNVCFFGCNIRKEIGFEKLRNFCLWQKVKSSNRLNRTFPTPTLSITKRPDHNTNMRSKGSGTVTCLKHKSEIHDTQHGLSFHQLLRCSGLTFLRLDQKRKYSL